MSKTRKKSTPGQYSLSLEKTFGALDGALDRSAGLIAEAIRRSRLSRDEVLDRLNVLLGRDISSAQFNAWLTESNKNRLPADVLAALAYVLDIGEAVESLFEPFGWKLADRKEQAYADLGRIQIEREQLAARDANARRIIKGGK